MYAGVVRILPTQNPGNVVSSCFNQLALFRLSGAAYIDKKLEDPQDASASCDLNALEPNVFEPWLCSRVHRLAWSVLQESWPILQSCKNFKLIVYSSCILRVGAFHRWTLCQIISYWYDVKYLPHKSAKGLKNGILWCPSNSRAGGSMQRVRVFRAFCGQWVTWRNFQHDRFAVETCVFRYNLQHF